MDGSPHARPWGTRRRRAAAVAILVFAVLGTAPPAAAQSVTTLTLVSNVGQVANTLPVGSAAHQAQAFTTGATGGTLSSVEIISETDEVEVAASVCTVDNNDHPTSTCTTLNPPPSFAAGTLVFTAPPGTTLDANTTYTLLVTSHGTAWSIGSTPRNEEDACRAAGWSIADAYHVKNSSDEWNTTITRFAFSITIRGMTTSTGTAPTVETVIPGQTATAGTEFSYAFPDDTFSDADNDPLGYAATQTGGAALPAWLTFSAATRTFSGTPQDADVETVSVRVTASDCNSGSVSDTFDIVVGAAPNTAPTSSGGEVTATEDTDYTFTAANFNFSDDDPSDTLSGVKVTSLPVSGTGTLRLDGTVITSSALPETVARADIDSNRLTYRPPANASGDDYATFQFTVSDGTDDSAATQMTIDVTAVNDAPTVARLIPDRTATAGTEFSYAFPASTFSDVDDTVLAYAATTPGGAVLPAWLNFTAATRTFTGTPQAADEGTVSVKVTASDGNGGSVSDIFDIVVGAAGNTNTAPRASNGEVIATEDTDYPLTAADFNFSDSDPADTLSSVTITSLPAAGTLRVDGTVITSSALPETVARADIDSNRLTYRPPANASGDDYATFQFTVSDGTDDSAAAQMTIDVTAVNDDPTVARLIPDRTATAGTAFSYAFPARTFSDADGNTLDYAAMRADGAVLPGWLTFTAATRTFTGTPQAADEGTVSVKVTASDGNGGSVSDTFDIVVSASAPVAPPSGGGAGPVVVGGRAGPSGPVPSDEDFEWTVTRDIEELDPGHGTPSGLWSDHTALWVLENGEGADDAVYAYDRGTGERDEEREFELHETNRAPHGIWSDERTAWVSDSGQERLYAYDLETGERREEREIVLAARNRDARGIWSDVETMWVLDARRDALFAYDLHTGALRGEYALAEQNGTSRGIWSDETTVWVSDDGLKWLIAYRLPAAPDSPAGEDAAATPLERVPGEDFSLLSRARNNSPRGIWSDGDVMYVADESDDRVYSYNMPDAIDARLGSLALSGVDIGGFDPKRVDYEGTSADGVMQTAVEARAAQRGASVAIDPPDADPETAGHQVMLAGAAAITVTVTSGDRSRTAVYRVRLGETDEPWAHCLSGAVASGFNIVFFEGGSIEELEACARDRHVTTLYALENGAWVPYVIGAPAFVYRAFGELFSGGVPPVTALLAGSGGPPSEDPAPEALLGQGSADCLHGEVATGFSIVVYRGGSVEELEACARGPGVATLYALENGAWVPYIIGAPAFVNRAFGEFYAGGLDPMTPLVARK